MPNRIAEGKRLAYEMVPTTCDVIDEALGALLNIVLHADRLALESQFREELQESDRKIKGETAKFRKALEAMCARALAAEGSVGTETCGHGVALSKACEECAKHSLNADPVAEARAYRNETARRALVCTDLLAEPMRHIANLLEEVEALQARTAEVCPQCDGARRFPRFAMDAKTCKMCSGHGAIWGAS